MTFEIYLLKIYNIQSLYPTFHLSFYESPLYNDTSYFEADKFDTLCLLQSYVFTDKRKNADERNALNPVILKKIIFLK